MNENGEDRDVVTGPPCSREQEDEAFRSLIALARERVAASGSPGETEGETVILNDADLRILTRTLNGTFYRLLVEYAKAAVVLRTEGVAGMVASLNLDADQLWQFVDEQLIRMQAEHRAGLAGGQ